MEEKLEMILLGGPLHGRIRTIERSDYEGDKMRFKPQQPSPMPVGHGYIDVGIMTQGGSVVLLWEGALPKPEEG